MEGGGAEGDFKSDPKTLSGAGRQVRLRKGERQCKDEEVSRFKIHGCFIIFKAEVLQEGSRKYM